MIPLTKPLTVFLIWSIGPVKMPLARSHAAPGLRKSDGPSVLRKSVNACLIADPTMPSALTCCATQSATFSKMPLLSSAWVISPPPGMNSMAARKTLAGLASTSFMLIGFTPSTMVNRRKPGMMLALSAM